MPEPPKLIKLKVLEALQDDAYKGIARIDTEVMRALGLNRGDIVSIQGERETVAIIDRSYPADIGEGIIRIDGLTRKNAKTGIGEKVTVRKAQVKPAKKVTIAPAQPGIVVQGDPEAFKSGLLGRAVLKGDIVSLGGAQRRRDLMHDMHEAFEDLQELFRGGLGFQNIRFKIISASPNQPVIITEDTELSVNPKATNVEEEDSIPEVTYEDIGGLTEEIRKIREMVELPLKHPEVFDRLGIEPPKGVLLHGPPGTGKTLLAKAVANESEANFILLNGPEIMSKFYGECVASDSLVFTNGSGLTTIQEAVKSGETHKISGINMSNQKAELLLVSDTYDKGLQKTLKVFTPHGIIELTPTSKLLVLNNTIPEWKFAQDLKISDKVAVANALPEIEEKIPPIFNFINDNVKFSGSWVKDLFNFNGKNKELSQKLGIPSKKIQDIKYNGSAPAKIIKEIYKEGFAESLKLSGKGRIPTKITKDLMYLLGILAGDGHLRYNYKDNHVSTIQLTNIDTEVINNFKRIVAEQFGIIDIKYDGRYSYYFSSSPIGNLIKNLGIPAKAKSKTISVPNYLISMPKEFIASYLQGLFDTDGHVHPVPSGTQVSYYTISKQMMNGVKYLLLRLDIQSTFRYRKDGTYELTISDTESLIKFKEKIKLSHQQRRVALDKIVKTKYSKPVYNRIPLQAIVVSMQKKHKISERNLIKMGLNPSVNGYTRNQSKTLISLLQKLNEDSRLIEQINILINNDLIWSPINIIQESEGHVYDFTVPKDHNFIANGFIVHNSEKKIRDLFEEAEKNAPSIIFIDEIDAIASKREETQGEVERRVVSQLLTMMDGLNSRGKVIVIGATNRINSIDHALRRPGRFDREIEISVPDKKGRLNILKIHTRAMPMKKDVNLEELAAKTHGFVGADLESLAKEAAMSVLRKALPDLNLDEDKEIPQEALEKMIIGKDDFDNALKVVRPSAMREVLVEMPNISWEDVGGLNTIKQELKEAVEWPIKHRESFERLGIKPPRGILLYGPPGTGKTLLAKAVAKESEANFINVKGPSLLSMWVGESEKGIRKIFEKARQVSPCVIFFDEIDALAGKRGMEMGSKVTERVLNQMLSEMDGIEDLKNVVVIGATNRPDMLDAALMRPGRFDRILLVDVPDEKSREKIIEIHTKTMPIFPTKDEIKEIERYFGKDSRLTPEMSDQQKLIQYLVRKTEGFVGADIESFVREAAIIALRKNIQTKVVTVTDFDEALVKVKPSVSEDTAKRYKKIEEHYLKKAKIGGLELGPLYAN